MLAKTIFSTSCAAPMLEVQRMCNPVILGEGYQDAAVALACPEKQHAGTSEAERIRHHRSNHFIDACGRSDGKLQSITEEVGTE